ncbi:MAG TPA: GWxTD domain-containing protein [Thermoanaerobaculia bacterium]|jgi:GWxTD domain-containing protein
MRFPAVRTFCLAIALLIAAAATAAPALDGRYSEWGKGPAQYLMTRDEAARWKAVRSHAEAESFVALFWARRDPTPDTPQNELRDRFETLIRYADEKLAGPRGRKGSQTDRGRVLLLLGPPDRVLRQQRAMSAATLQQETESVLLWTYEGDVARELFDTARAEIVFTDRANSGDWVLERGGAELTTATQRLLAKQITQPDLTAPRNFAIATAVPARTELSKPLQDAIDAFRKDGRSPHQIYATWGEFITAGGTHFVPVSLYVPRSAGITTSRDVTFFGVVIDGEGKSLLTFEQPSKLAITKDDAFIERSLTALPPGKHRAVFGLAEGTTPVALVGVDLELTALDQEAVATSPLILSNNIYPLTSQQSPTDPYSFGGVKVVPKGDRLFRTSDELWYFLELRNPGLNELKQPRIQVKIDVEGTAADGKPVRITAPPREVEAPEMKGVPGHHGIGSSIPLATFKPGEYTFTIKVTDTVRKSSYTLKERFRVVG